MEWLITHYGNRYSTKAMQRVRMSKGEEDTGKRRILNYDLIQ